MPHVTYYSDDRNDSTLTNAESDAAEFVSRDSCIVQIYPPDMIDGMRRIEGESLTIGRDTDCDIHLEDSSVSRRHASLIRCDNEFEVVDHESTNGTFVNGERASQQRLRSGDCIKIGSYLFKFLSAGSLETAYHETVYSVMTTDPLTGAFRKDYLLDNLRREIARSVRHRRQLSLVMCDIDRFKTINDNYGHLVGDEVLREFGRRLAARTRADDLFARWGGEEFAFVLTETSLENAMTFCESLRKVVADSPFETSAGKIEMTCSLGVAQFDETLHNEPHDLIRVADDRLYQAKQQGRNRTVGA